MNQQVLYTGAFRFPDGDAAAFRVASVARLFELTHCTVSFAGWESAPVGGQSYTNDGHACFAQAEFRTAPLGPMARLAGFLLRGHKTLRWLARNRRFDIIVAYNPPAIFAAALLLLGRLWRIEVVLDSTEWYDAEHLPGGRHGLAALENWARMRIVYPRFRHVICISRFLERHYASRNVVLIPPLMPDGLRIKRQGKPPEQEIVFAYAGQPGRKDRIAPFIGALPVLQEALGKRLRLRLAGPTWNEVAKLLEAVGVDADRCRKHLECHGQLSRGEVLGLYREAHFSILFREDRRYAWAGFPTKAVESWSCGCPLITNAVGDLATIAENGVDAIVMSDDDALLQNMAKALTACSEQARWRAMSDASVQKAEQAFAPAAHAVAFERFVERLRADARPQRTLSMKS